MISGVASQPSEETALPSEILGGDAHIEGVVNAFMRIGWIVATILAQIRGENADTHWLQQLRHQQRRNNDVAGCDAPVGETEQDLRRFRNLLRNLDRSL